MKRYFGSAILIILLLSDAVFACSVIISGLRTEFRRSKNIFVGEIVIGNETNEPKIPEKLKEKWNTLEKVRFKIIQSWKGQSSGEIDLFLSPLCDCPNRMLLPEDDSKILVFTDKDGVLDACNMYVGNIDDVRRKEEIDKTIKKLNSFWFRTWARAYPF